MIYCEDCDKKIKDGEKIWQLITGPYSNEWNSVNGERIDYTWCEACEAKKDFSK